MKKKVRRTKGTDGEPGLWGAGKWLRSIWLCLLGCLLCLAARGHSDSVRLSDGHVLRHFDVSTGLPTNFVYQVITDRRGYLWIATEHGVLKYNGYRFKVFDAENGLPYNDIWHIYEDRFDRIWFFSISHKQGYVRNDKYQTVVFKGKSYENYYYPRYVKEYGGMLYLYFQNALENILAYSNSPDSLLNSYTGNFSFLGIRNNRLIYQAGDGSVYQLRLDTPVLNYRKLYQTADDLSGMRSSDDGFSDLYNLIYDRSTDQLRITDLITRRSKSFAFSDVVHSKTERYKELRFSEEHPFLISDSAAYSFYVMPDLSIGQIKKYPLPSAWQYTYSVHTFDGSHWYSTSNSGLYQVFGTWDFLNSGPFHKMEMPDGSVKVGGHENLYAIYYDGRQGELYGVSDSINTLQLPYRSQDAKSPFKVVLMRDWHTGLVLYPDKPAALFRYTPIGKGRYTASFAHDDRPVLVHNPWGKDTLKMGQIDLNKSFYVVDSNLFLAVGGGGSRIYVLGPDTVHAYHVDRERHMHIARDAFRNLMVGYNSESITFIDPYSRRSAIIKAAALARFGITDIRSVEVDKAGRYFVHEKGRLIVVDPSKGIFKKMVLPFNILNAHVAVRDSLLVAAGAFGIATALVTPDMDIRSVMVCPNITGLLYNQVWDMAIVGRSQRVILHTDKGYFEATIAKLRSDTSMTLPERQGVFRLVLDEPYEQVIHDGDTLFVPPGTQSIKLDAINFMATGQLQFRIKIGSEDWQQSSSGELFTGNMSPDHYHEALVSVRDRAWNGNVVRFHIFLQPNWYQTRGWIKVFWIGVLILFALLIVIVVLITRSIVQKSNEKKRQLIELELRALYAQINPHFIFNSLNSAQYFINARDIDRAYDHVNKFSRLLRSYLKSSHDRYVTVAEEVAMLHNYIELQQERFRQPFLYTIKVDNKIPAASVQIPSLLLQPLVENAINHGLFHKKEQGHLSIEFLQGGSHDELICIIEDDGVGRERAKEINRNNTATRLGSYGTRLTEQLINIFERYEQMNIKVNYTDKPFPQTGTIVTLIIRNIHYVT